MDSPGISSSACTDFILALSFLKDFSCWVFPSALSLLRWHRQPSVTCCWWRLHQQCTHLLSITLLPISLNLSVLNQEMSKSFPSPLVPFPLPGITNLTWYVVVNPASVYISSAALNRLWTLCGTFLLCQSSLGIIFLLDIFFMGVIFLGNALRAAVIAQEASWTGYFNFHGVDRKQQIPCGYCSFCLFLDSVSRLA